MWKAHPVAEFILQNMYMGLLWGFITPAEGMKSAGLDQGEKLICDTGLKIELANDNREFRN